MSVPYTLSLGDCLETLRSLPDNSIDSVVTDPPYGIRFMGKSWDGADIEARASYRASMPSHASACGPNGGHRSLAAEAGKYDLTPAGMLAFQSFTLEWAAECLRVLKPGGYLLSFSAARTYHHMAVGIEMAGFEIRDQIMWVFGSGFPKSHNLRGEYEGWGTALKPAHEPICMARKPLSGTVLANVLEHGTGAINIDACRVPAEAMKPNTGSGGLPRRREDEQRGKGIVTQPSPLGRWPANLIHDGSDDVRAAFPEALGQQGDLKETGRARPSSGRFGDMAPPAAHKARQEQDTNASRFFYCAKTSKRDRGEGNSHPTVKPTDLMAYLCRLVTPLGGTILDPFMGSGSTGKAALREGFQFIGCELDESYMAIARARIEHEYNVMKAEAVPANDNSGQMDMDEVWGAGQ